MRIYNKWFLELWWYLIERFKKMKYECKNCEKEFLRKDVYTIQKKITLTGALGDMPHTLEFALCKPCAKELGYKLPTKVNSTDERKI